MKNVSFPVGQRQPTPPEHSPKTVSSRIHTQIQLHSNSKMVADFGPILNNRSRQSIVPSALDLNQ